MAMSGYSLPVVYEPISAVTTAPKTQPGERICYAGEEYVYVYNNGGSQINPTYAAVVSALSGASVTVSSLTNAGAPYGVCKHATITTGAYGWLLVRGFVNLVNGMASTAVAAGDLVELAANGAVAAHGSAVPFAKAMAATGSAGSFAAQVRCWG